MKASWATLPLMACVLLSARGDESTDAPVTKAEATTSVGMVGGPIERILPGSELEVAPVQDSPIVVRILNSYKHGDSYRYELSYYGLEPGSYDLTDFLRRKDGLPSDDLPPIPVVVESVLLADNDINPSELTPGKLPRVGGYRIALIVGGVLWLAVLLALLFAGKRRRLDPIAESQRKKSLAEQLRPLVESAVAGKSTPAQLAALEQMLLVYWRKRLGVEHLSPAAAIAALKDNPSAAELLVQLESWLHRPGPPAPVDVAQLLLPYQQLLTAADSPRSGIDPQSSAWAPSKEPAR